MGLCVKMWLNGCWKISEPRFLQDEQDLNPAHLVHLVKIKVQDNYFAKLTALVSRITVIFTCPGYVISV